MSDDEGGSAIWELEPSPNRLIVQTTVQRAIADFHRSPRTPVMAITGRTPTLGMEDLPLPSSSLPTTSSPTSTSTSSSTSTSYPPNPSHPNPSHPSTHQPTLPPPSTSASTCPLCGHSRNVWIEELDEDDDAPDLVEHFSLLASPPPSPSQPSGGGADEIGEDGYATGYYHAFFEEVGKLGSGIAGGVYLCKHHLSSIDVGLFAVKKIPVGTSVKMLEEKLAEVKILRSVQHPNVIRFLHTWLEVCANPADFGPDIPCLFILMEFANAGNVAELLGLPDSFPTTSASSSQSTQPSVAERVAARRAAKRSSNPSPSSTSPIQDLDSPTRQMMLWSMIKDIASGLAHLHASGVVHCDLKPENVLVHETTTASGSSQLRLLLSDFGQSRPVSAPHHRTGGTGTLRHLAPELLARDAQNNLSHLQTFESDVWAFGIMIFRMITLSSPYDESRDLVDQISGIQDPVNPTAWPPLTHDPTVDTLLRQMLAHDPRNRPSSADVLAYIASHAPVVSSPVSRAIIPYKVRQRQLVIARKVSLPSLRHRHRRRLPALPPSSPQPTTANTTNTTAAVSHESHGISLTLFTSAIILAFAIGYALALARA